MDPWDENTPECRRNYLAALDNELLTGIVELSGWTCFMVRAVNDAFVAGAWLSALLTSVAAIETHLRTELRQDRYSLQQLIEESGLNPSVREEIHSLRRVRNAYVHVDGPWDDAVFEWDDGAMHQQLREQTFDAMRTLRHVLYAWQIGRTAASHNANHE